MAQCSLAGKRFREVLLAVAVHTCDPEHLSRPELEAHLAQWSLGEIRRGNRSAQHERRGLASIDGTGAAQLASQQNFEFALMALIGRGARAGRAYAGRTYAGRAEYHSNHGLGPLALAHRLQPLRFDFACDRPQAQDGNAVAELIGLEQLVGHQNQCDASFLETTHHAAEIGHALRRQHRGWLIEEQQFLVAPERTHDFDLLLLAERQTGHRRVRIDAGAEQGRQLIEAAQRRAAREARAARIRRASDFR